MNLCLGTVQFGMNYGILNQKKPSREYAIRCLEYATNNGINSIDTAKAYGDAEEIVGYFLQTRSVSRDQLFISTKLLPNILDEINPLDYQSVIENEITSQLKTLHTDYVDAYVFHSARYAYDERKLEALRCVVDKGFAKKCGVSIYEPEEAWACYDSGLVDFIQAPYSIFDHRMKNSGVIDKSQEYNCELHTRSAFIQGLITMDADQIPSFLEKAKPIVRRIADLCEQEHISRTHLAIQYVKREKGISHLVFGVNSLEQLKENIRYFNKDISEDLFKKIDNEFDGIEADIVMPSLWKR